MQLHCVWVEELGAGFAELRLRRPRIYTETAKVSTTKDTKVHKGMQLTGGGRRSSILFKQPADGVFYRGPCFRARVDKIEMAGGRDFGVVHILSLRFL